MDLKLRLALVLSMQIFWRAALSHGNQASIGAMSLAILGGSQHSLAHGPGVMRLSARNRAPTEDNALAANMRPMRAHENGCAGPFRSIRELG